MNETMGFILLILIVVLFIAIILRVNLSGNKSIIKSILSSIIESTKEEKKESYAFVRSTIINIFAGVFATIIFLNLTIWQYGLDIDNINNNTLQQSVIEKYKYLDKDLYINKDESFILNDIKNKIQSEENDYEKDLNALIENKALAWISPIFIFIFFFSTMNDKSLKFLTIVKNTIIEGFICSLAYAFILAILFSDINSYISAIIISCGSLLVIVLARRKKKHT